MLPLVGGGVLFVDSAFREARRIDGDKPSGHVMCSFVEGKLISVKTVQV